MKVLLEAKNGVLVYFSFQKAVLFEKDRMLADVSNTYTYTCTCTWDRQSCTCSAFVRHVWGVFRACVGRFEGMLASYVGYVSGMFGNCLGVFGTSSGHVYAMCWGVFVTCFARDRGGAAQRDAWGDRFTVSSGELER